jgi:alpha-glucosidase
MPFNGSASAGFSSGKPWMRVNPDNVVCNVEDQEQDADSVLAFWRAALALRRAHDVLVYGIFELLLAPTLGAQDVVVYARTLGEKRAVYVASLGFEEVEVDLTKAGLTEEMQPALAVGSERSMHVLQGLEARLYVL